MAVLLDRIGAQPRQVDVRRAVLTGLAGVLYGLGWLLATALRLVLAAATVVLYVSGRAAGWAFVAIRLGWQDAQAQGSRRRGSA